MRNRAVWGICAAALWTGSATAQRHGAGRAGGAPLGARAGVGIGTYGGLGYAGWGYGNYGFQYPLSRFGYGGGFGLGAPLGTWGAPPSVFAPRPLAPSAAPAWLDRSRRSPLLADEDISDASAAAAPALSAPPAAELNTVLVKLVLPAADAIVWFGDQSMPGAGAEREFRSPPLAPGQSYVYAFKARWTANGQPVERAKSATVRAGDNITVSFAENEPAPANVRIAPPPPVPEIAPALQDVPRESLVKIPAG